MVVFVVAAVVVVVVYATGVLVLVVVVVTRTVPYCTGGACGICKSHDSMLFDVQ